MSDLAGTFAMGMICVLLLALPGVGHGSTQEKPLRPVVEVEEDVYSHAPADNGARPLWSYGSSCIARVGADVFISGLETLTDAKPMNNVRWELFHRSGKKWDVVAKGDGRTREPCPLAAVGDAGLYLSDNPTLIAPDMYKGPAKPQLWVFSATEPTRAPELIVPEWQGQPQFTEHSYRSVAADGATGELILFQNVGDTHAVWTFRDGSGKWAAQGELKWPWGAEYPEPQAVRVCYPAVALKDRKVYFFGVSDIVEPYPEWREYKREITGRDWDYDFRRLFFTWSDDITTGEFHDWVEVASRDATCGWMRATDLWVAADGTVHLLWTDRALDERLREKFFPEAKQSQALMYGVMREGALVTTRPLLISGEGLPSSETPGTGRFHVTGDGRLFVLFYVTGEDAEGNPAPENRMLEILPDGSSTEAVRVDFAKPFSRWEMAGVRNGCAPSNVMDIYGETAQVKNTLRYARVRIE